MSEELEFTSKDMESWAEQEVRKVLKSLLRNLTEVRKQRGMIEDGAPLARKMQIRGEVEGLNIAISAVRRRIR